MNESEFFDKGVEYINANEMELAIKEFSKEININPSIAAYLFRALCYYNLKQNDKSIEDCNKVLELDPNEKEGYILRAKNYMETEQFDEAIFDLDEVIRFDPNNVSAYNDRGFASGVVGFYDNAIDDFKKSIEIDPNPENVAYKNLEFIQSQKEKRPERLNAFLKEAEESGLAAKLYPPGYKFIVD